MLKRIHILLLALAVLLGFAISAVGDYYRPGDMGGYYKGPAGGSGPLAGDGLLLEDGTGFVLLENGDYLLLE